MKWRAGALLVVVAAAAAVGLGLLAACGAQGFDPASKVDSVRMFAARADKPYARPGEMVTIDVLMTDARREKPRPLELYWVPIVCMNPRDDLYYLCFAPPSGDAGATGGRDGGMRLVPAGPLADGGIPGGAAGFGGGRAGALEQIPEGVDLGPFLPRGTSFTFRMPDDAIQRRAGIDPYGLAVVFNVACAGQIVLAARNASAGPQQVPIQCVDEDGRALPPSDYVIGIARVYAYATRVNTNPVTEGVTLDGTSVDLAAGITIDRCRASRRSECEKHTIDIRVSDASWEGNPGETANGQEFREQIWADYYSDLGSFDGTARLLFDARKGRVGESEIDYRAPNDPAEGTIWIVVHDNRGGAAWVAVPLHVR